MQVTHSHLSKHFVVRDNQSYIGHWALQIPSDQLSRISVRTIQWYMPKVWLDNLRHAEDMVLEWQKSVALARWPHTRSRHEAKLRKWKKRRDKLKQAIVLLKLLPAKEGA